MAQARQSSKSTASQIRRARHEAALTQEQLAQRAGMHQSTLSDIERGAVVARPDTVQRLLRACERRPAQLLERARERVLTLLADRGCRNPMVFGSIVRDSDRPGSDVDLAVELPESMGLVELVAMQRELEEIIGCPVDLVDVRTMRPGPALDRITAELTPL